MALFCELYEITRNALLIAATNHFYGYFNKSLKDYLNQLVYLPRNFAHKAYGSIDNHGTFL